MTATTATKHLPTTLQGYGYKPLLQTGTIVVEGLVRTNFKLCHISIVPEGSEGRQVHGGPQVPGPWGFTTTHALVIDNFGGSGREADEAPHRITVGEPFTVEGLPGTWTLESPRRNRADGDGARLVAYEG